MTGERSTTSRYGEWRYAAPVRPTRESPAVDAMGPGFALTTVTGPIAALTGARARLLALSAAERRHVVVLTRDGARMTPALHEALEVFGGRWTVQTAAGLRDAATGARVDGLEQAATLRGVAELAPEHADIGLDREDLRAIAVITGVIQHRHAATARVGDAVRAIASALLGEAVIDWGVREPVLAPWLGDEVAVFFHERGPQAASVLMSGSGEDGRVIVASTRTRTTPFGLEEAFTVRVELDHLDEVDSSERWLGVSEALVELHGIGTLLNATASAEFGPADLSIWPWLRAPAIPIALAVGWPAVSRFRIGDERAALEEHFDAEFVGPRRRASLIVELGERPHSDNAAELLALLGVLGPKAVVAGLGRSTPAELFGAAWESATLAAATERLGRPPAWAASDDDERAGVTAGTAGSDPESADAHVHREEPA